MTPIPFACDASSCQIRQNAGSMIDHEETFTSPVFFKWFPDNGATNRNKICTEIFVKS